MVFVNSQKFACASCIKGHRSSSCDHADRPLFKIHKKGRPVSQCERCRELRRNKRMHVKCTCADIVASESDTVFEHCGSSSSKTRQPARRVPSTPTLPNGLRDLWTQNNPPPEGSHLKQRLDSLLNPCHCKSIRKCKCTVKREASSTKAIITEDATAALIQPCSNGGGSEPGNSGDGETSSNGMKIPASAASPHSEGKRLVTVPCIHSPHTRSSTSITSQFSPGHVPDTQLDSVSELDLPPLKRQGNLDSDVEITPLVLPSFKNIWPSLLDEHDMHAAAVASLTRCGCGSMCTCPGCKEHRGESAALSAGDCPDSCGSCVDHMGGIAFPKPCSIVVTPLPIETSPHNHQLNNGAGGARLSTFDHFSAITALLPPPPQSRVYTSGTPNPTDVVVYQQPSAGKESWHKAGLVQLPPLNCCAGKCKCSGGMCGCGTKCGGNCRKIHPKNLKQHENTSVGCGDVANEIAGSARATGSCCAGKRTGAGSA